MSHLLGELRREMNGAVVGSMRFYGADYGLNYGVSLPTIRSLAQDEAKDSEATSDYARYLYLQQVRELRLAAVWIADPEQINESNLEFWADGIINTEVAEETAFALMYKVEAVDNWLSSENELLVYCALLSLAKSGRFDLNNLKDVVLIAVGKDKNFISSAVITILEKAYRDEDNRSLVASILDSISTINNSSSHYIIEEMSWRMEC